MSELVLGRIVIWSVGFGYRILGRIFRISDPDPDSVSDLGYYGQYGGYCKVSRISGKASVAQQASYRIARPQLMATQPQRPLEGCPGGCCKPIGRKFRLQLACTVPDTCLCHLSDSDTQCIFGYLLCLRTCATCRIRIQYPDYPKQPTTRFGQAYRIRIFRISGNRPSTSTFCFPPNDYATRPACSSFEN